ncbi:hypothetical protein Ddye_014070 [Dipteronia dyeriana]|uniref:Uncharacterized protein n=1 Tax=Dipteronia dyeriana TaxID=168575 RepID=A0AAD9X7H0_9ROSI|nr:hypothetical protein Ddye_014070 [Dipteronia dyeriana]
MGELVALREGLLLADKLQLKISCVEMDACNVVAKVSNCLVDVGVSEFVFSDVMALFKVVEVQNCHSISKIGNWMAHNLVALAVSSKEVFMWQMFASVLFPLVFPCLL